MKVLMLGWEFPPHISGGLGTACYGMTRGLDRIGVEVSFVLPKAAYAEPQSHVRLHTPAQAVQRRRRRMQAAQHAGNCPDAPGLAEFEHVSFHRIDATICPYGQPADYHTGPGCIPDELLCQADQTNWITQKPLDDELHADLNLSNASAAEHDPANRVIVPVGQTSGAGADYEGDLMGQVHRYASLAVDVAMSEEFDVIHAHDWMTFPAAVAASAAAGKPLVVHVHSTEFDRSGNNVNQQVYDIERTGMHVASRVICVSHFTKNIVIDRYGVSPAKCRVIHNAVDLPEGAGVGEPIKTSEKLVLFLGRVTMQKGPEYFLRAARKVVDRFPNVRFVMAGSGDMITQCVREVADLGLGRHVTFTGFLRGRDVDRIYQMADLYVMPSVSEPFGIAPLEALSRNVPVIISRQSGVAEVLTHALKVDFWDLDEMANKILAVLRHPPLQKTLRHHGQIEVNKFNWIDVARKLNEVYADATLPRSASPSAGNDH